MNRLLKSAAIAAIVITSLSTLPATKANAFWGGWWPWNWGDGWDGPGYWRRPWGYPGYGWGGYPGYGWGGYPGYGWGGYPGYGWGGYPAYGGWGYPAYGWGGYPGYATAPLAQALPPEPKPADTTKSK
jgi:hypothetical protein